MKAVHSFKSDKIKLMLESIGGPAMLKPLISIMALSATSISRQFKDFVLITDDAGKELAEACAMPYSDIISVGPQFGAHPDYWIESKIHAYAELHEPFVHFDTDLFLWKPLPEQFLQAPVFAFHSETFMWPTYERYLNTWSDLLPDFPKLHKKHFTNRMPINMAIFGGNNWQAINKYAKFVQDFVAQHQGFHNLPADKTALIDASIAAIEQLWGSYLLQDEQGIQVEMLLSEQQVANNMDVPGVSLTHLHGLKQKMDREGKTRELLEKLSVKLKEQDETVYNAVQEFTSGEVDIDSMLKESLAHGTNL